MESLRPLQKAAFTDVLDYGVFLFRKNFKKLFIINLIFNIPVMLLLTILNPIFTQQYWNIFDAADMIAADPGEIFSSIFTLYAMMFGSLALQGIYSVTLKNVIEGSIVKILYADTVLNQNRSIKQVIRECFGQFGTLFLGRLIYILIQCAVFIALYIVFFIGIFMVAFSTMGLAVTSMASPVISVILTVLGVLIALGALFIISILVGYFYGKYWMFLPAICIEQQKAGSSIGRCNDLGKNGFKLIGFSFAFGYMLIWLLPFTVSSAFSVAGLISGDYDVGMIRISTVITQIFSEVLRPLLTCILTALYITLKVKREGLDLEVALWEIKREEIERKKRMHQEAPNAN
ncbi:MAG TPA: hypothetical protein VIL05_04015 [Thermoclostridium sp.]